MEPAHYFRKRGWLPMLATAGLVWISLIPLPFIKEIAFDAADKAGHFGAFFFLSGLYLWAFGAFHFRMEKSLNTSCRVFFITVFIGGMIELLQHYLPVNRYGDWFDFFFDIAGTIAALLLLTMIKKRFFIPAVLFFLIIATTPGRAQNAYEEAKAFQDTLNAGYADPETSPLTPEDLVGFKALNFFPIDTAYRVIAHIMRVMDASFFPMPTTTDRLPEYHLWAVTEFELNGKNFELNIYQNKKLIGHPEYSDYLFLPFTDLTNGETTYGGGRYIDLRFPQGDSVIIV